MNNSLPPLPVCAHSPRIARTTFGSSAGSAGELAFPVNGAEGVTAMAYVRDENIGGVERHVIRIEMPDGNSLNIGGGGGNLLEAGREAAAKAGEKALGAAESVADE